MSKNIVSFHPWKNLVTICLVDSDFAEKLPSFSVCNTIEDFHLKIAYFKKKIYFKNVVLFQWQI